MKFLGTAGKWKVERDGDEHHVYLQEFGCFGTSYIAKEICQGNDEGAYDALLISKSPEMFALLLELLESGKLTKEQELRTHKLLKEATEL